MEPTDRQLLDWELARLTKEGWRIVSQSDTNFQVSQPRAVNEGWAAILVTLPMVFGGLLSVFIPIFGGALIGIGLFFAILFAIAFISQKPKLWFVTAAELRARMHQAPRAT